MMNHDPSYDDVSKAIEKWLEHSEKPPSDLITRWLSPPSFWANIQWIEKARWIDRELARMIYERHSAGSLVRNPSLSADVVAAVAEWLVDDWEAQLRGGHFIHPCPWDFLEDLFEHHGAKIPIEIFQRIYHTLPGLAKDSCPPTQDQNDIDSSRARSDFERNLSHLTATIVTNRIPVPPDLLVSMLPYARVAQILEHPSVDTNVLRIALKKLPTSPIVVRRAVKDPALRRDPEARKLFLDSGDPGTLYHLATDEDPSISREALQLLLQLHDTPFSSYFLHLALEYRLNQNLAIPLSPEELFPLLQSNSEQNRLIAIMCMGRLQPSASRPPRQSRSGTRKKQAIRRKPTR